MNPGFIGLLLSLNNMAYYGGPEWQLSDMSVVTHDVCILKKMILEHPGFNFEMFRNNGFNRVGNTGIYATNNLRKYIFPELNLPNVKRLVQSNEQGVLIIFIYEPRTNLNYSNEKDSSLHILALDEEIDPDLSRALLWNAAKG